MTASIELEDGHGTESKARIDSVGTVHVIAHPHPPLVEHVFAEPFRQFFTDDGLSTGDEDMAVDGSSTNVKFWIKAHATKDIYIKTIQFIIADAGAELNEFGNVAARTNGVLFEHFTQAGTTTIHDGLKSNFDFVYLCGNNPVIGNGNSSYKANNVSGNSEAYTPTLDFALMYGMPFGLRIRAGSEDKLQFTVRDNCSAPDRFDIIGKGQTIVEDH